MSSPERDVMASLLRTNADFVASVLAGGRSDGDGGDESSVLGAMAAIRSLSVIVEDTLRSLVDQARTEGRTWAEIGGVLHVSRQAAFQRFGGGGGAAAARDPAASERSVAAEPVAGARELAVAVVRAFLAEDWERTRAPFDERMLELCSPELLASVRVRVRDGGGDLVELGIPELTMRAGITVVEVPLSFERSDAVSQVAIDPDAKVCGFFIRPAGL